MIPEQPGPSLLPLGGWQDTVGPSASTGVSVIGQRTQHDDLGSGLPASKPLANWLWEPSSPIAVIVSPLLLN